LTGFTIKFRMKKVKSEQDLQNFPKINGEFPIAHRRWLVCEIESGRISMQQAIEQFNFQSKNPIALLKNWRKRYAPQIAVTLPVMTEKERQKLEVLQKRVKDLEKRLEDAQMKNVALETLIDVAEEKLNVPIRKKAGSRQ